jgi:hypothetical protein
MQGTYRAVKIVRRSSFDHERPFEREFEGIQKFEPISRTHDSQVDILHVGGTGGMMRRSATSADALRGMAPTLAADLRPLENAVGFPKLRTTARVWH